MSIRTQIAALLTGLSVIFVAITYAVQVWVVMPSFSELEQRAVARDVKRCVEAILLEIETLSNIANDWGAWDDSYQYVIDKNTAFANANLVDEAFSSTHINLIGILDADRKLVWGDIRDMDTLEAIDVPGLFGELQKSACPLTALDSVDDQKGGVLLTSRGILLVASRPMITTKREGPIRGTVIMGRFLNEAETTGLAARTHTAMDIWTVHQHGIPDTIRRAFKACIETGGELLEVVDDRTQYAYTVMNDLYGQPAMLLRVHIPREITAQGRVSTRLATGCSILGGIFTLLAIWAVMEWRILAPLQKMADHALRVGSLDDLKARLGFRRRDEIGTLAGEFDRMVENLAESRKKVLDTAHRAGMAEIASEVLHNVGNAVNSANCSVELLNEQLGRSRVSGLERATSLLREQAPRAAEFFGNDPRGPKLIDYLVTLTESLKEESRENLEQVDRLRETVRHIRDAIATQQSFAGRPNFLQEVELSLLVRDVLRINEDLIRSCGVEVSLDLDGLPELQLNKSKMTQVLVNLVRNAVQSMATGSDRGRQLKITARQDGQTGVMIEVTDSGSGFDDATRERLFMHGFTTKADGNGFGLHYCANAVREMGGEITAESPGSGRGASFRIRLPDAIAKAETAGPEMESPG